MWEGVRHMTPFPTPSHQRIEKRLVNVLTPTCDGRGLELFGEIGVYDPERKDGRSYRGPDVAIAEPEHVSDRGIEGRTILLVEIRSPRDETDAKIPFYEKVGVEAMLIIDRDTLALELRLNPVGVGGALVVAAPDAAGWLVVATLNVAFRHRTLDDGPAIEVRLPDGTTALLSARPPRKP